MKGYLCSLLSIFLINALRAQPIKDTIYFDESWSICEKPVAEYYRVASIKADKQIMYVGDVIDHYIKGSVEMTGAYDENGKKNGHFIFFNKSGLKTKEGDFEQDVIKGLWSYYNESGSLIVQFNCKSSIDFTPLLIVNPSGDTIIQNGNGHFVFNSQTDLPQIFPVSANYTLEGQVVNGKKEGEYKYWINSRDGKPQPFCVDVYSNDLFKKSKSRDTKESCGLLNLAAESNLGKTDYFYHSNLVFGFGNEGDQKVIRYLLNGEVPEIKSEAHSYSENIKDVYNVIGAALRPVLMPTSWSKLYYTYPPPVGAGCDILSFSISKRPTVLPRVINSDIVITIDTSGYISNSVFKGNMSITEINKINYYLSRLSNLVPLNVNGRTMNSDLTIKFITLLSIPATNTPEDNLSCVYLAMNKDSIQANYLSANNQEKAASFTGGIYGWRKYLEVALRADAPVLDRAPEGTYFVKVKFLVNEEGNIGDVQIIEAPKKCPHCSFEAERVIKNSPKWNPASRDGKNIKYQAQEVITFITGLNFNTISLPPSL